MKINFLINLFIICTLSLVSCIDKPEEIKMDFEIGLPNDWSSQMLANEGFVFVAGRNPENELDTICESLRVNKNSMPAGNTLSTFFNIARESVQNSELYKSVIYESDTIINSTNFKKLISREYVNFVNPAIKDTFQLDFITERFFFYERNYGYHMVFYSPEEKYIDPNRNTFDIIMNSFQYKY